MNLLTTNIQQLHASGATILKGRAKGNYFRVLYKQGDTVLCKTESGTTSAEVISKLESHQALNHTR